jgi:hypothetical protein
MEERREESERTTFGREEEQTEGRTVTQFLR